MIAFVDHEDEISPNLNLDYCIFILQTRQPYFADVEVDSTTGSFSATSISFIMGAGKLRS
jgi:hypothetical protein